MSNQNQIIRSTVWMVVVAAVLAVNAAPLRAADVDGFTEPYRTINVSAAEQGTIEEMLVKEGDAVRKGQLLAMLDMDLYEASSNIAKAGMESVGRIKSAAAMVELRKERLKKLKELQAEGHANPEEVSRAEAELGVAEAELLTAKEDNHIKELEYARIQTQIARRKIISPINGYVTKVQKEVSEYVSATDPILLTVVQCDRLKIIFPVPAAESHRFSVGKTVPVKFSEDSEEPEGVVEAVSPVTDPESGTVRVKVVIDNSEGLYRSGMACLLTVSPPIQPITDFDKNAEN